MDQLRSLMQSALAQRLGEHLRAEVSPLANLPNVQGQSIPQRAVSGLRLGTMLPRDLLDTLGLAREAVDYGAKALTGGIAQEVGGIQQIDNPVLRNAANATSFLLPGGPATAITALLGEAGRLGLPSPFGPSDFRNAMQAGADNRGNFIANARAANEGLARESPLATGLLNQIVNPLTYATGGGTEAARAAQQTERIASGLGLDLGTVTNILYPEGQLAHTVGSALVGAAAPKIAGVLGDKLMGDILQRRYGLPAPPIPGVTADRNLMAEVPAKDRAAQLLKALHDVNGPALPPEFGPVFPEKGNIKGTIGPTLPGLQDVPLPPELGPQLPLGGNLPPDQLIPGVGRNGGRGIGPLLPGVQGPTPPVPAQDIADLLGAARQVAQPNRLEQLLGAARNVAGRRGSGILGAAKQASADLATPATPTTDTLGLTRDLLKSGDSGKGMVYAPADPQFWQKRVGVDPAAVPALLRQLQAEGSLAPDQTGELLNTYLTGKARATPATTKAEYDRLYGLWQRADPAEQPGILARMQALVAADAPLSNVNVAPDLPGGSLDLPAMPGYPGQTRAEARSGNWRNSPTATRGR
jgi:hypothetical protein